MKIIPENYKTIDSVKNLTCFLEEINKIQSREDAVWYRGQYDSDHRLIPSALRDLTELEAVKEAL